MPSQLLVAWAIRLDLGSERLILPYVFPKDLRMFLGLAGLWSFVSGFEGLLLLQRFPLHRVLVRLLRANLKQRRNIAIVVLLLPRPVHLLEFPGRLWLYR